MKLQNSLLPIAVFAVLSSACNSHSDEPDTNRNVPVLLSWQPAYYSLDWGNATSVEKAVVKELTTGVKIINTPEELAALKEYDLFDSLLSGMNVDFSAYTILVNYELITGIPKNTSYNVYFRTVPGEKGEPGGYVFNVTYAYNTHSSADFDDLYLTRNAVMVNKLRAGASVTFTSGIKVSDIWN